MALLINKNLTVRGDTDVSQIYVRLVVNYGPTGNNITVTPFVYTSKTSYNHDFDNYFRLEGVSSPMSFPYDRETAGSDLLTFAHESFKNLLSSDVTRQSAVLDEITGEVTLDPSTGEVIMEDIVEIEKFAMDSSIVFDI